MAKANVVKHNGSPAICIDGKVYPPMTATVVSYKMPVEKGEMIIDEEYYKSLGESGIKIYYVMCNNLYLDKDGIKKFTREASTLLSAVPDAYIMVRINLNPSKKWMDENPGEIFTYNGGKTIPCTMRVESYIVEADGTLALYSDKWRNDYEKALEETMDEIEKLPFADRIIGYFLGGGCNCEWFHATPSHYYDKGLFGDFSDAFKKEFTEYLDKTYGKGVKEPEIPDLDSHFFAVEFDKRIENPGAILSSQTAPDPIELDSNHGAFLNMKTHKNTFDFYNAQGLGVAKSILHFSKIVKDRNPDLLTGSFYGGISYGSGFSVSQGGVSELLNSGLIDFLANPGMYENRQPGGFTGQRQCHDSFRLHNAMFIVEDDTRTHAENAYFGNDYEMFTLDDTINVLKRDFGRNISDDLQSWWYDQHRGGGRYKFPEVYKLFEKQQKIAELAYSMDRTKGNEVAFIYDDETPMLVSRRTTDDTVIDFRNYEIARTGFGSDLYLHNDMSHPDMPDYKLYVFCNCVYLSDKEREQIKNKLKKNNATALFLYGSGYVNPDREEIMSVDNMAELMEISCKEKTELYYSKFKVSGNHPIVKNLDKGKWYGEFDRTKKPNQSFVTPYMPKSYLIPLLYADDKNSTTIANFLQDGTPAVSVKEADGFTSIYCGSKFISAEFVREVARFAGCHIYEEDENVVYVNKNFLTVHASKTGTITLKFPKECSPYELYEEKYYGENVTAISFDMLRGETKMFKIGE